jgi:hypothetical protein
MTDARRLPAAWQRASLRVRLLVSIATILSVVAAIVFLIVAVYAPDRIGKAPRSPSDQAAPRS